MDRLLEVLAAAILAATTPSAPPAKPPNCDLPAAKRTAQTVLVYLVKQNFNSGLAARPSQYVARPRAITKAQARAPLRASLLELFEGSTRRERRLGCISTFERSAWLLRDLAIVDGQAIVNFHPRLVRRYGYASTLTGGAVFMTQLKLTIFQFPGIESIRFELDGSCRRFYAWQQAGECYIFRRANA